jgi:hypothetical protein
LLSELAETMIPDPEPTMNAGVSPSSPTNALGSALLFFRALEGRTCVLRSKRWIGLVEVGRVSADVRHTCLQLVPKDSDAFPVRGKEAFSFSLSGPSKSLRYHAWEAGFSVGYGMDALIHDTRVVEALTRLAASGASWPELRAAVNLGEGLPDEVRTLVARPAEPPPEPPSRGRPTLSWTHWANQRAVQLSDLPTPHPSLLAWVEEYPHALLQAAALWVSGGAPAAMQHLLACDRAFRRAHPAARPAIEESAERLFAHKPELAMLYAMRFEGVFIAADMSDKAWLRLLGDLARHAGWDLAELHLDPTGGETSKHIVRGRDFSIES